MLFLLSFEVQIFLKPKFTEVLSFRNFEVTSQDFLQKILLLCSCYYYNYYFEAKKKCTQLCYCTIFATDWLSLTSQQVKQN